PQIDPVYMNMTIRTSTEVYIVPGSINPSCDRSDEHAQGESISPKFPPKPVKVPQIDPVYMNMPTRTSTEVNMVPGSTNPNGDKSEPTEIRENISQRFLPHPVKVT